MDSRWLGVVALGIIVALGGWYVFSHPTSRTGPIDDSGMRPATTTDMVATTTATGDMPLAPVTVSYTKAGFQPATIAVVEVQSVTFINQSGEMMWVASDPHPSHTGYDGTSRSAHCAQTYTGMAPFDSCAGIPVGESYTFTFTKIGSWGYHNHAHDQMSGKVIVTPTSASVTVTASTTINVH